MKYREGFLPTKTNDYTPHLLQRAAMLLMTGLVLLSFVAVNIQSVVWLSSDWLVGTVLPAVVIEKTNEERDGLAETPLIRNPLLDEAARLKAEDMAKQGYFSHYSPSGVSPWYWFEVVDYQYAHAGENLAVHFTDSAAVVDAWMDSPTHRANIVNGVYTEIGVGTAKGEYQGFDTVFVVQLFGTPAAAIQPAAPIVAPIGAVEAVTEVSGEAAVLPPTVVLGETIDSEMTEVVASEEVPRVENLTAAEPVQSTESSLSFMATSSTLVPALASERDLLGTYQSGTTPAAGLATTPSQVLRYIYLFLGMLIASLLLSSIAIGMRYHRPWQVVYGVGLLMIMSGLFYLHSLITANVVVAADVASDVPYEEA